MSRAESGHAGVTAFWVCSGWVGILDVSMCMALPSMQTYPLRQDESPEKALVVFYVDQAECFQEG